MREIKHEKIDYIFTTCPPYSVHLIGLLLKMITGVKWIADFRDPWMTTGSKRTYPTCLLSLKIERWLEKMVIQKSDMVTFNVERLKEEYKKKYNSQPSAKFVYIPNGFDPALFSRYKSLEKYDKFTLTYTGSLYVGRTPEPIFKAVKMLVEDGRIDIQKVRIKLIGSCKNIDGAPTSRLIDYYSLEKVVETLDTVPYSDALEIVKRAILPYSLRQTFSSRYLQRFMTIWVSAQRFWLWQMKAQQQILLIQQALAGHFVHQIYQGLWNLSINHFAIKSH